MSRGKGGSIIGPKGPTGVVDAASAKWDSSGIWTLAEVLQHKAAGNWPPATLDVDYLLLGGGGGGKMGGGGGGGYRLGSDSPEDASSGTRLTGQTSGGTHIAAGTREPYMELFPNADYYITLGAGGAIGADGGNTVFSTLDTTTVNLIAYGGGKGGALAIPPLSPPGIAAGSSGVGSAGGGQQSQTGAATTDHTDQGFGGGLGYNAGAASYHGGGGGAGNAASTSGGTDKQLARGGGGVASDISGVNTYRGGGGSGGASPRGLVAPPTQGGVVGAAGGAWSDYGTPINGTYAAKSNKGGGGGGGMAHSSHPGSEGIIILAMSTSYTASFPEGGVTFTLVTGGSVGAKNVYVITAVTDTKKVKFSVV